MYIERNHDFFSFCECQFQYRRDLHERRHHVTGGMFRCLRCGRHFGAKSDLEKHVKGGACPGRQRTMATTTATSTSPPASSSASHHRCNVCADAFDTKAGLILHSVRHIKEQVRKGFDWLYRGARLIVPRFWNSKFEQIGGL